jgi:hypothetical protein
VTLKLVAKIYAQKVCAENEKQKRIPKVDAQKVDAEKWKAKVCRRRLCLKMKLTPKKRKSSRKKLN